MCQYNNELKWTVNKPLTVYKIIKVGHDDYGRNIVYQALFATVKKSPTSHPMYDTPFLYEIGKTYTEDYETLMSSRIEVSRGFFHSFPTLKLALNYKEFLEETTHSYYGSLVICECEIPSDTPYYRGTYIDMWNDSPSIASKAITIKRVIPRDELEKAI